MSFRPPGGDGPVPYPREVARPPLSVQCVSRRWRVRAAAVATLLLGPFVIGLQNADAATITAKGGTGFLNSKKSWYDNKQPTSADIALWDSNSAATTASLGSNISWLGIRIVNPGGNITFNSGNTLTLGSSGIDMSAATVNFTMNCGVALSVAQTWSVASGRTLAVNGVVSGAGGITKTGAGMLSLTASNSYTGATTVSGGTLSVTNAAALGSGSAALTINATGIFQANGTFSTSRALALGGTGGAASGGTIDVVGTNNHTRSGAISGSGSLIKTGTGTLTLSGTNTSTGGLYVNGGTVVASTNQALGPEPAAGSSLYATHMASGTTLQTQTSLTGHRQLDLVGGTATLSVASATTQQRNGLVYGAGGLIKSGAGTLVLTNANTYTGGTTVNAGTLQVNNTTGSGTGTGAVAVNNGGTLSGLPTATGFANAGTIAGNVTVNSGGAIAARSGGTFTFGGLALNGGAITNLQLGAPTGTAIINITGLNGLTLGGLSTINISNFGGLAAGTYTLLNYNGTALASITNLQLGSTAGGGFTYSLSNNQTNTSIDLLISPSNQQWANDANGNWSLGSNWTNGSAPNAIGAQANFFGIINQARTVTVDGAFTTGTITFDSLHSYTVAGSGVSGHGLTLNNNGVANISVLRGSHTIAASITLASNLQINAASGTALTLSGAISGSAGSWTIGSDGSGVVTFSGAASNSYGGLTTVASGNLNLNKSVGVNAIGTGGIQIDSGATASLLASHQIADTASAVVNGTLALGASSETLGALDGVGSVTTAAAGLLTVGASNNLSSQFDGVISGSGTIAKSGTGTFALTGANTFGGAGQTVALNAGTLRISSDANLGNVANSVTFGGGSLALGGSMSSSRNLVLNANTTIDTETNTASLGGTISGTGGLTKAGAGTMTMTGTNTYAGGTTINGGTITVNHASNLGATSSLLTVNHGTFRVATGFTGSRNIVLGSSNSTIDVAAAQTYTAGGVLSGTGALNKAGSGTLLLSGANTFTGQTVIDAGTVTAAASSGSALGTTTAITVNESGTLLLGANNQINNTASVTLAGGTIAKGNYSEGSSSTAGFGALTLEVTDSRLNFGTGTVGTLTFASFNSDALRLIVDNWTGTANTVGSATTDRLIFNSDQSANLALFSFSGYADGATQFQLANGYYEITPMTPVPEPSTYAAAALAAVLVGYRFIRQRKSRRTRRFAGN